MPIKKTISTILPILTLITALLFMAEVYSSQSTNPIIERYEYDMNGRIAAKIVPDGRKMTYQYNTQGLLTEIKYPDGWTRYGYDENSNPIWMKDKAGSAEYYYDAFDRLIGVIWKYCPSVRAVIYDYTPLGQVSYMAILDLQTLDREPVYNDFLKELKQDPSKTIRWIDRENKFSKILRQLKLEGHQKRQRLLEYEVTYRYDILGNLIGIDTKDGSIKYSYYPEKGQVERQLPNGIVTTFTYYPDGLLKSIHHKNNSGQLIGEYNYEYNTEGKVTKVDELTSEVAKSTEYSWDSRGYLKELRLPDDETIQYNYNVMGNRISKKDATRELHYEYDGFGRLIHVNPRYEWDANGNLISETDAQKITKIGYDGRGLPSLVKTPTDIIHYQWNSVGNMISRNIRGDVSYYLPNPIMPSSATLAEFNKVGKLTSSYLYGNGLIGQRDINSRMNYFLEDGFRSIRQIADTTGRIIGKQDYLPFGEPLNVDSKISGNFCASGIRFLPEIKSYTLERGSFYNTQVGVTNQYYTPIGYRSQDYGNRIFDRAKLLIEQGQRLPMSKGLSEKGLRQAEPEYYKMIDELAYAPDITDINSLIRLMYFGTPGLILSHWTRQAAIGASFIDRTQTSQFVAAFARRSELLFSDFIRSHKGGYLIADQFEGLQGQEDFVNNISSYWNLIRGAGNAYQRSFERHNRVVFGSPWAYDAGGPSKSPWFYKDEPGQFRWDYRLFEDRLNRGIFLRNSARTIAGWFVFDEAGSLIGGEKTYTERAVNGISSISDRYNQRKSFKGPNWPDNHGGGSGRLRSPLGDGFTDPFNHVESKLGGIKLSATGEFIGELGNIVGAVFDEEKQCLVLIGDRDISVPDLKSQDLAVALAAIFGSQPQDPQFSLDPADPRDPRGKWLKAVYIPEQVITGTEFGKTMFEADWLLKQYSFGISIDEDGKQHPTKSSVPGFKSVADLSLELKNDDYGKESWARFWIVVDKINDNSDYNVIMKQSNDGKAFYFDPVKMCVKAKKQMIDPSSPTGLKDVDSYDDPTALRFADGFTELYDKIARESTDFERVRQLAKTIALAKWLKKEGIAVDMDWVVKSVNRRIKTIDKITALSVQHERQSQKPYSQGNATGIVTTTERLYLFGGVDLSVIPKYDPDNKNGKAFKLQEAVRFRLRQKDTSPIFTIQVEGASYRVAVLPVTKNGQEIREKLPVIESNGITYQFDDQKNVTKSMTKNGNVGEYEYDADGKLNLVKITNNNGWTVIGERNKGSSLWTAASPKGNILKYVYDGNGYLSKVEADGVVWANYQFDPILRKRTARYDNYIEVATFEENNSIKKYEIQAGKEDITSAPQTEKLTFTYNEANNITKVEDNGSLLVGVAYAEDNIRPLTITMPQGEIKYTYHPDGLIKEIADLTGVTTSFAYDGEHLANMQFNKDGAQAEYLFNKDGIVRSRDLLGNVTDYEYTDGKLTSVKFGQYGEAKYVYDRKGRLRRMRFPDGIWIEYKYGSDGKTLMVLTHPSNEAYLFEEKVEAKDEETNTDLKEDKIVKEKPNNKSKKVILFVLVSLLMLGATGVVLSGLIKSWPTEEGGFKDHDKDDFLY